MENGIKKNTRTRVLLFIPFFISLPRTHSNYRNNQARWRLGNAEMSIVVTSNDGKKNSSRLGKITSLDFNYKTCLVRVPNASYRCAVWKFSKKAGFAKVCSAETLTGTGYTKHQVYRLNVASNRQRLMMTFPMETPCLCIKVDPRLYIYDSGGKFFD